MKVFKCRIINKGFFTGKALKKSTEKSSVNYTLDVDEEVIELKKAVSELRQKDILFENPLMKNANEEFEEIIRMIIEDDSFIDKIENIIREEFCDACSATLQAADIVSEGLNSSEYMAERGADIRGAAELIVNAIKQKDLCKQPDYEYAFTATEVSPADMLFMDRSRMRAIISCKGSTGSHTAIIAGNLDIPYMICPEEALDCISDGCMLVVNGYEGRLIIDPDVDVLKNAQELIGQESVNCIINENKIADNRIRINANYSGTESIDEILNSGADGIGLFRTELKFMDREEYPSEEEQFSVYTEVVKTFAPEEVIIRTFDIGSEKKVKWLNLPEEPNPALGFRGTRAMLSNRTVFSVQLKALLRAAVYGNMKIMFPMISAEWEIDEVKKEISKVAEELEGRKENYRIPPLGIMIETPAAVLCAEKLAEKVDFFSIGTNDLSQYTFAIDRESNLYDSYSQQMTEVLINMIDCVVKSAHSRNIKVGICGQMAADLELTGKLISLGVDELSVPLGSVKKIRLNKSISR